MTSILITLIMVVLVVIIIYLSGLCISLQEENDDLEDRCDMLQHRLKSYAVEEMTKQDYLKECE